MAIAKEEIEKYIFDPKNPKQCKSYKLLARIAKRENAVFFSPDFLQYFLGQTLLNGKFKDELWDIPNNYDKLSFSQKIDLYIEQLSQAELDEFKKSIEDEELPLNNIFRYPFFKKFIMPQPNSILRAPCNIILRPVEKEDFIKYTKSALFSSDRAFELFCYYPQKPYLDNFIIFSKNHFSILQANIEKSSIFITLEENIEKFLENEHNNVKPIFLKKIEDVDTLLNVLQKDIQQEKHASKAQEEIASIDLVRIKNFYSIEDLEMRNLKDKKEVYIVGENGDGKTLLLQSIAIGLAGIKEGDVFDLVKTQNEATIEVVDSKDIQHTKDDAAYEYMVAYGASRYNSCQMREDEAGYLTLFENRYDLRSPVEWLQYLDHSEKSNKENIISVAEAKQLLNELLNKDVDIEITPDNVTFEEKGSKVSFEQLSAGYKGVITIMCDLIARLYEKQPYVRDIKDFRGVVLIDEVELHLHPKWKYNFMKKLRDVFPHIQFIVTTHSPTVILGASKEAVFYKIYKDDGKITISNQLPNEGYTNNSLISSPLFDLETISSRGYKESISSDDYIYSKIHQVLANKIKNDVNISEDELLKQIEEELAKI